MTFNIITCIPLNIHPCRNELLKSVFKLKRETKTWEHVLLTVSLLTFTAVLGFYFPNVISAFGILGGSCAVMLVIFFPGKNNPMVELII